MCCSDHLDSQGPPYLIHLLPSMRQYDEPGDDEGRDDDEDLDDDDEHEDNMTMMMVTLMMMMMMVVMRKDEEYVLLFLSRCYYLLFPMLMELHDPNCHHRISYIH